MAAITTRTDKNGRTKYTVRIRIRGQEPQTATFGRRTDAQQWAHFMESEIRMGKRIPTCEARRRTLSEAIDRYIATVLQEKPKSLTKQTMQLNVWRRRFGHKFLVDITPALLAEERDQMMNEFTYKGTKRSPSTVARYMSALSHMFTIAMQEWDWVDDNPFRKVRKPREPRGRLRHEKEKSTGNTTNTPTMKEGKSSGMKEPASAYAPATSFMPPPPPNCNLISGPENGG